MNRILCVLLLWEKVFIRPASFFFEIGNSHEKLWRSVILNFESMLAFKTKSFLLKPKSSQIVKRWLLKWKLENDSVVALYNKFFACYTINIYKIRLVNYLNQS